MNGVHISEVPTFLVESHGETTHATELFDSFDTTHLLIILLQLSGVTSYYDAYSLSVAEYENTGIPKIHVTAEENAWDKSTNENSERETQM